MEYTIILNVHHICLQPKHWMPELFNFLLIIKMIIIIKITKGGEEEKEEAL